MPKTRRGPPPGQGRTLQLVTGPAHPAHLAHRTRRGAPPGQRLQLVSGPAHPSHLAHRGCGEGAEEEEGQWAEEEEEEVPVAAQPSAKRQKVAAGACDDLLAPAVVQRVRRLNVNLDAPIQLKLCGASLADLKAADALKILDHLEACGDAVDNPTAWIIERVSKQMGGGAKAAREGESATPEVAQLQKLGNKLDRVVNEIAKGKGGRKGKEKKSCKGGRDGCGGKGKSCKGDKEGGLGDRKLEEDQRVLRKLAEINRSGVLAEPLKFARVKPFLDILPSLRARLDILDLLARRAPQIQSSGVGSPERWLSVSCAKNVAYEGASKSQGGAKGKGGADKGKGKGKPFDGRPAARPAQPGPRPSRGPPTAQEEFDDDDEFEELWAEEAEEALQA